MKMTPDLIRAAQKMKPGVLSKDGFLGSDTRDLATIIADQRAWCLRLGVSWEDIADAMEEVGRCGIEGFGCSIETGGKWEVRADENRGKIPSPFVEPGMFQKTIYYVKNIRTGQSVRYTELSIHMIRKHGFFQGQGAPFYHSPEELVEVFELTPATEPPDVEKMI